MLRRMEEDFLFLAGGATVTRNLGWGHELGGPLALVGGGGKMARDSCLACGCKNKRGDPGMSPFLIFARPKAGPAILFFQKEG